MANINIVEALQEIVMGGIRVKLTHCPVTNDAIRAIAEIKTRAGLEQGLLMLDKIMVVMAIRKTQLEKNKEMIHGE